MRVLDLFSGSGSATKPFEDRGHRVYTIDIEPQYKPEFILDINKLGVGKFIKGFDFIWASPPCTCFSVASISTHWTGGHRAYIPKTEQAIESIKLVKHTLKIIKESGCKFWVMENPRGVLRKIIEPPETTVAYCRYGDERMKPTDLWGKFPKSFEPRQMCKNGDKCHVEARRGAKTGTQGRKNDFERGKVPYELGLDLCVAMENELIKKWKKTEEEKQIQNGNS